MKKVASDSQTSCPIVCGQFMRATGFFFSTGERTFLITARHNVLPTNGQNVQSGNISMGFKIEDFRPTIDVYLRTSDGFDVKTLDIREIDGVRQSPEIDVLAVPFEPNPEEYGYVVWNADNITSPKKSTETLDIIGFNGTAFPNDDHDYSLKLYCNAIGLPSTLQVMNEMPKIGESFKGGLMAVAVDQKFVGDDEDYNGFSGAPVLGDGLVGIHSLNWKAPSEVLNQVGEGDIMHIVYTRAEILPKMLA